jgi:type II secretory pathway component PulF
VAEQNQAEVRTDRPLETASPHLSGRYTPRWWPGINRVPLKAVAAFWWQLVLLIEVGVPLLRALHQIEQRTSHPGLRQVIQQVADAIERGNSFSEALAQHPHIFSSLTIQVVEVAERGGVLDESLQLVANELERQVEIRSKVKRALSYPAIIALLGIALTCFVLIVVIPQFSGMFQEHGVELPLPTRIITTGADFLAGYWWLCLLVIVALWGLVTMYIRTPDGRLRWDRCKLRLPLVGDLLIKAGVLRFAQTMGTLLRGGVPILPSLRLVQEHAENRVLAQDLERVYAAVDQGERLETPLRQARAFPPLAVDIIAIGEEAGQLDTILFKLSDIYKEEVDHATSIFSSIIEPLLLLLMGAFVALIVWAVYLPYFSLPKFF